MITMHHLGRHGTDPLAAIAGWPGPVSGPRWPIPPVPSRWPF